MNADQERQAKPRLRGTLHQYAAAAAVGAGAVLLAIAPSGPTTVAVAVFAASLALQFGVSAVLHRGDWTGRSEDWLRRLDHAAIFVLIAGTYTPFAVVGLPGPEAATLLFFAWGGAAIGIVYCTCFLHASKRWRAILAVAVGWTVLPWIGQVSEVYGWATFGLILGGGALYTLGAVIYATERPRLWPRTFGFHEAFHLLTVFAATLHFAAVLSILDRTAAGR